MSCVWCYTLNRKEDSVRGNGVWPVSSFLMMPREPPRVHFRPISTQIPNSEQFLFLEKSFTFRSKQVILGTVSNTKQQKVPSCRKWPIWSSNAKCQIIFGKEFFGRNLIWCLFVYNRSSSLIHSGVTNDARPPSPRSSPDSVSLKVQISRFLVSRFSREYHDLPDLETGLTGWHNSVCRNQLTAPSVIQLQGLFHLK